MKINILLFLAFAFILTSCYNSPDYPDTPKITFNNVIYKKSEEGDSLIILIDFEDGNGDIGLSADETSEPFNEKTYFSNRTGRPFQFGTEADENLMTIQDTASIDSLPPFSGIYECLNWDTSPEIYYSDGTQLEDTVYFQFNKRYNNIFINYYLQNGEDFRFFDWRTEIDCGSNYDGRIPVLSDKTGKHSVLEGTIRYAMFSLSFARFNSETLKFRIQIVDREGNYSNVVETPAFTLEEILQD